MRSYHEIAYTPSVQEAQRAHGTREAADRMASANVDDARLGPREQLFVETRDHFFLASVGEGGWPYVQHRGGPAGFLKVLDDKSLAFADYRGNRQYITQGNVAADGRASLFLIDYPQQVRMKLYARAEVKRAEDDPELAAKVKDEGYRAVLDRIVVLHVEAFDWNCPQHITPRWTAEELRPEVAPLQQRIAELEAENRRLEAEAAHLVPSCD